MQIDLARLNFFITQYARYSSNSTDRENDTYWQVFAEDICEALTKRNQQAIAASVNISLGRYLFDTILQTNCFPKSILTFNFIPKLTFKQTNFLDSAKSPVVGILLDHPVHIIQDVISSYKNYKEFFYGVMADSHKVFLINAGIRPEQIFTLPHGGPPLKTDVPRLKERTIDISFFGRIEDMPTLKKYAATTGITDPEQINGLKELENSLLNLEGDLYQLCNNYLKKYGLAENISVMQRYRFARELDARVRSKRRMKLFGKLAKLKVNFYGTFSEKFKRANKQGIFHEPVSFRNAQQIIQNSKIFLSDNILDEAVITRPFYGMANQSLVASQYNSVLSKKFSPPHHMLDLDAENIVQQITENLNDLEAAQKRVNQTSTVYQKNFTFDTTITALNDFINTLQ
jgi:hypothetical protein